MNRQQKAHTGFVFAFFCFAYLCIILNLYYIQIQQKDFYSNLARRQYTVAITKPTERAPIFDRSGTTLLALNKNSTSAFILPSALHDADKLLLFLQDHFPGAVERFHTAHKNGSRFMYIKRKLTDQDISLIQDSGLSDIKLLHEPNRFYPTEAAAPVVGITNIDNTGILGIELYCNKILAGEPSAFVLEQDARSRHFYFTKETKIQGTPGTPIMLTLDSTLQFLAYEELKDTIAKFNAKEGAVIIMDPATGDIITMASFPSFDPNNTYLFSSENAKNRCLTESYELGSVIKVFCALAALEEGVVTPDELIDCQDSKTAYIDGRKVNTVLPAGVIPFSQVVELSNNIGIATVAKRLDTQLYDHYRRLGFGNKTALQFPGEQTGYVNPPSSWSKQSIISLSYGYEITATLLQLACAFCTIANDGIAVDPQLIIAPEKPTQHKRLYSHESSMALKTILEKTTARGTARRAAIKGYKVMSKTGTANILVDGVYNPNLNIYTCAGIIEKDSYKRVIVTFVKEAAQANLYASRVAAPLFERVATKVLIHDKVL